MSRIGKSPVVIPETVKVKVEGSVVTVEGVKGMLKQEIPDKDIGVSIKDNKVLVVANNNSRQTRAFHGLVRNLIKNMVIGVDQGYEKRLELVGTGYRVKKEGKDIEMSLGFSHPVKMLAPEGIEFVVEGNDVILVKGSDKRLVGQMAANIRAVRSPEPYKGKGVRYTGGVVRRKAGKAAKAAE